MDYWRCWAVGTAAVDYIRLLVVEDNLTGRVDIQGIQKHRVEGMASNLGTDLKKTKRVFLLSIEGHELSNGYNSI